MSTTIEAISKGYILFMLEKNTLLKEESLEELILTMEKDMDSPDWVEYAALMKKEGFKNKEICKRVNKSESWIKKYVNPKLESVTLPVKLIPAGDTSEQLKPGLPIHTILKFTISELKKETRTFGGWGSVEVLDSQEEVVSIEGLEAIMPTYMKRGAPIQYGHSNRHVGNVFKYQIRDKLVKGESKPALWLEGRIFNDYKIDDMAWEAIQYAYSAGLPVLSLGATPIGHPEVVCNDTACFKKYNTFQLYEFTITEQQKGSIGANPEATVEVALSKSMEEKQVDSTIKKKIGEHLYHLQKSSALPENENDLVNMMLATCGSCQDEYQKMIKLGRTEDEAKAILLKELVDSLNKTQDEKDNINNESDEIKKSAPISKENTDLAAALIKISDRLDKIELSITKTTSDPTNTNAGMVPGNKIIKEDKEEEEEEEEEAQKANLADAAKNPPAQMEFSKESLEKYMADYIKKEGFQKVAETPVPDASGGRTVPEIAKGEIAKDKPPMPTLEEQLDAIAQRRLTHLGAKYGY